MNASLKIIILLLFCIACNFVWAHYSFFFHIISEKQHTATVNIYSSQSYIVFPTRRGSLSSRMVPVIWSPAVIISWPKATDVKTRKLLTTHGGLHLKSCTLGLCAEQKGGS